MQGIATAFSLRLRLHCKAARARGVIRILVARNEGPDREIRSRQG